uniref:Uncharacterized protein n=2 Tax=Avena sativa TaxID=4498 RepID=A0ACD5XE65_AVESA
MGFFTKSTSKQTAKLKSLVKIALARLAVARRPRVGRRSIARGDVAQLLSIGHLDRALVRAGQVIEEDDMLEVLDLLELYCRLLIDHAAQLEKPKECGEEVRAAAAGLVFASARCGELPELLDARAILADKFGRDFAAAAKDGSHGLVDPTLVRKLSGEKASVEQMRRLAKEIAAENDILLDFPEDPREVHHVQSKQSVQQPKNVPAEKSVEQLEAKTESCVVQERRSRPADASVNRPSLVQLSAEEKTSRESRQYRDVRMAAEAAFESASFAAMAARAAVELSRTETQRKGPRGGRGGGGHDKVHPLRNSGATERETRPQGKPLSPSPSPSWSENSTVSSVWSDPPQKGKTVVFDQSDEEDDEVVELEDLVRIPQLRRPPYGRTASTVGINDDNTHGSHRRHASEVAGEVGAFQHGVPNGSGQAPPTHRRHASELAGGNALREAPDQRGHYGVPPPPYRRNPAANGNSDAARRAGDVDGGRPRGRQDGGGGGGAYESSAYVGRAPYARIVSALEGSNEHIARHEEVRRMGTDARVLQEKVYGPAAPAPGRVPMTPERRAISVRTRR